MERKTRYEVQELFVVEYDTDGSIEFITESSQKFWYRDKIKGTVKPEKSLTKGTRRIYKVRQGEIFDELWKHFVEKDSRKCKRQNQQGSKNRKFQMKREGCIAEAAHEKRTKTRCAQLSVV